jgi:Mat/Ecp fimbriae major subunit
MKKFLATAGAVAVLALTSTPAAAVSPATQATATAKIYKPLTISSLQNLDFGVVVLNGASFSGETVVLSTGGVVTTCGTTAGDLVCSGSPQAAKYHLAGSNNANVTITSPGFNLVNGAATLAFVPAFTGTVNLGATGAIDVPFGGTISGLSNTTPDGVYTGNFAVTADYQ